MRTILAGVVVLAASSACLRSTQFKCETDDQCGPGAQCQTSVGFCSSPDPTCGQRFTDSAGPLAGTCVGGAGTDGSVDAPRPIDGPMPIDGPATADAPVNDCPGGYNLLPGITGHRYKTLPAAAQWDQQAAACASGSAGAHPFTYLAVPDDPTETTALDGSAAGPSYWVGIQSGVGSAFVTSIGSAATFLPWGSGQPNGTGCANMAAGGPAAGTMDVEKCSSPSAKHSAICECEP